MCSAKKHLFEIAVSVQREKSFGYFTGQPLCPHGGKSGLLCSELFEFSRFWPTSGGYFWGMDHFFKKKGQKSSQRIGDHFLPIQQKLLWRILLQIDRHCTSNNRIVSMNKIVQAVVVTSQKCWRGFLAGYWRDVHFLHYLSSYWEEAVKFKCQS